MPRTFSPAIWLCLSSWIGLCSLTSAQQSSFAFEHFTQEDGMPEPVTRIVQDSFGFLWLGTMDGLCRFDGKNVVHYRSRGSDENTLSNNIINDLCVDPQNRIWAATNGGLCYYDYADGLFHRVLFDTELETLDRHRVHALHNAAHGGMWFATKTILHWWNGDSICAVIRLPQSEKDLTIKCLHEDKNGLWIGSNQGIFLYHPIRKTLLNGDVTSPFSRANQYTVTLHPVIPFHNDTLLVGGWYGGVNKVFLQGEKIQTINLEDTGESDARKYVIKGLCPGRNNEYWAGSYGLGLSIWNSTKGEFTHHFRHNPANAQSLASDFVYDVYMDPSGILWVATAAGLDKLDPLSQQFTSFQIPVTSSEFSVYRLAGSIQEDVHDPSYLWFCVPGVGLFHYNPSTHDYHLYQHIRDDPHALPDNGVFFTYTDHEQQMWVGTQTELLLFDRITGRFRPSPASQHLQIRGAHLILQDSTNDYWIATRSNGIYYFNPSQDTVIHFGHDLSATNGLPDGRIFCMRFDKHGMLWVGTQNQGLCKLNPQTKEFTYFRHVKTDSTSLPDNGVYEIIEDERGALWVATENGLGFMQEEGVFKTYTTYDGLANNTVYSIIQDMDGQFWLGTNGGLTRFDSGTGQFKNYYMTDGLPSNHVPGALYVHSDGTLYFGTTGQIHACRPSMMKMNRRIPPVIITQFRIFDKEFPVHRTHDMIEPIHLSYRENMITFEFAALNFTQASMNQYAYKLEGFDAQWINAGSKQSATYTNLDGGTYTFRVKAANNDGVWNHQGTYVTMIVHPPYWQTWWFYLLVVLLISGVLFIAYRFRINQIMKVQQIRARISRDLHDDIGSTLSSINLVSTMAIRTKDTPSEEKFKVISTASRQAMDLMSDIVWSIHPDHDRMEMLLVRMRQYASEILEAADIAFTLEMDEATRKSVLPVEKRKDFYLIYKEAINNLAKHSRATKAVIDFHMEGTTLVMSIADNGKGFDIHAVQAGNGLKNMKTRAQHLAGQLETESQPGKGTRMVLRIP